MSHDLSIRNGTAADTLGLEEPRAPLAMDSDQLTACGDVARIPQVVRIGPAA